MPIVFAFCRTAPSVRFIAFATSATDVFAFECTLSSRTSSLVHGLRARVFFFGIAPLPLRRSVVTFVASQHLSRASMGFLTHRSLVSVGQVRRVPRRLKLLQIE